ncbi:MAG: hypothetical protein ABMA64_05425 [Myxococcota bacterium]
MARWSMWIVGALSLACSGGAPAPEPEPAPAPAPAPPPPEPADEDEGGRSLLPKLERSDEPRPDDCTLDVAGMTAVLEKSQTGAAKPARMRREPNRLVEKVRFDDGTDLRIVRGGCAHIGETWEMAPVVADGDLVATAIAAFGRAKTTDDPTWKPILKKGVELGEDGAVPCGDANCSLKLEGEVLTFHYDFAL